jgi:uncharacterized membrane protein YgcG
MLNQGKITLVRYIGTAVVCVAVAFGAAFMVRRATDHSSRAHATIAAATLSAKTVDHHPTIRHPATRHRAARAGRQAPAVKSLAAQFTPGLASVRPKHRKPKRKAHPPASTSVGTASANVENTTPVQTPPVAPAEPTSVAPTPTTAAAPTHTTTSSSPPASSSGGSSGSGSTSIGGGSSSGRGSGVTTIGG